MNLKIFNLILTLILFVSLPEKTFGQKKANFGVSFGIGLTTMTGNASEITNLSSDIGYTLGLNFEQEFSERTSLKLNLLYSRKNVKREYDTLPNFPETSEVDFLKMSFDYLEIPVMIQYELISQSDFFANGGVFMGYLINTKLSEEDIPPDLLATPWTKKIDYGLSFGIAKKFSFNQNKLVLELRDNIGFKNLVDPDSSFKLRSNTLYLLVTWQFGK